jgi:hypothetical protein
MRNYCRFWITVLHYDDGSGNVYPLSVFFESRKQRDDFFLNFPQPPAFIVDHVYDQHVWMWLNKRLFGTYLNATVGSAQWSPAGPPFDSFTTPNGEWGEKSPYFARADQDPLRDAT